MTGKRTLLPTLSSHFFLPFRRIFIGVNFTNVSDRWLGNCNVILILSSLWGQWTLRSQMWKATLWEFRWESCELLGHLEPHSGNLFSQSVSRRESCGWLLQSIFLLSLTLSFSSVTFSPSSSRRSWTVLLLLKVLWVTLTQEKVNWKVQIRICPRGLSLSTDGLFPVRTIVTHNVCSIVSTFLSRVSLSLSLSLERERENRKAKQPFSFDTQKEKRMCFSFFSQVENGPMS